MTYKSRKTQILAIAREVESGKTTLREALKSAAVVSAAEERSRVLAIVRQMSPPGHYCTRDFENAICATPIFLVLGYKP